MSPLAFVAASSSQYPGIAWAVLLCLVLIVLAVMSALRIARRKVETDRTRGGFAALRSPSAFERIEPPVRTLPKRYLSPLAVRGRLTQIELLEIENRCRENANLAAHAHRPTTGMAVRLMTQEERLALVDVPRLLAHVRLLEERALGKPGEVIPLHKGVRL